MRIYFRDPGCTAASPTHSFSASTCEDANSDAEFVVSGDRLNLVEEQRTDGNGIGAVDYEEIRGASGWIDLRGERVRQGQQVHGVGVGGVRSTMWMNTKGATSSGFLSHLTETSGV